MFKTREIRWFFQEVTESITQWFEENGYLFDNTEIRTDYYLPLQEKKDLGIKLRENNIEIKQRLSRSEKVEFTVQATGYFEEYTKWSFSSAEGDTLVQEITEQDKYDWMPVKKERIGFKLTEDNSGKILRLRLDEFPEYGCQIEYTRIKVKDKIWYTFALEWFGKYHLKFDYSIINEILNENELKAYQSSGYAEFLNRF
ncbi:MAG: hypothetical protein KJO51_03435 [Gramella sp.]|nr:hypothetical protein [Christiangramia sp.]